jgi:hypothetical protein
MLSFKYFITESNLHTISLHEHSELYSREHAVQNFLFGPANDYTPFANLSDSEHNLLVNSKYLSESVHNNSSNPKSLVFRSENPGSGPKGIVVPKHMWEGGASVAGMKERNRLRAAVYGSENRPPLTRGAIEKLHSSILEEHFKKPIDEQLRLEKEAIKRLSSAGHLDSKDTTDESEKTDTVRKETDEHGRNFEARCSKGVAGHAVYTSGHGENETHHVLNTCPGQTTGCGGGVDAEGLSDTSRGTCFAPKAERQYPAAAVRRACHAQAKHDPAMSGDWILAHTHSIRKHADALDSGLTYNSRTGKFVTPRGGPNPPKRFLFRPNVVDETGVSDRHVLRHLNNQRAQLEQIDGKQRPPIIANSYGKTTELHDPENNYHVTYSNTGPKVKNGAIVRENYKRDNNRVNQTQLATKGTNGGDLTNENGNSVPPKNSYLVINSRRGSELNKQFETHVKYAKYWSAGKHESELSEKEKQEPSEAHYDGDGKLTSPEKAHYGHVTVTGSDGANRRYFYQKHNILHPRLVNVDGHDIPTDSRFKDEDFVPAEERYKSRNGKKAGIILATTPTTSTSVDQHHSNFTHHVDDNTIKHAMGNNGEYEIDSPAEQEKARSNGSKEYVPPIYIKSIQRRNT